MALAAPALAGLAIPVIRYLLPWPPFTEEGMTVIGAQLTLSESRLSDGFAPMNEPARGEGERIAVGGLSTG